jgi:YD repeat-containing protein
MLTEQFPRTGTTVKNTYTYTGGALTSVTDQPSHATTINTYNGTGQPTQITDPNGVIINFVYNNRNWLTSKTVHASPNNEVTSYTLTPSGQVNVITLPDSSTLTYSYDNAQRVTKNSNTAGETINYTLDALDDTGRGRPAHDRYWRRSRRRGGAFLALACPPARKRHEREAYMPSTHCLAKFVAGVSWLTEASVARQ